MQFIIALMVSVFNSHLTSNPNSKEQLVSGNGNTVIRLLKQSFLKNVSVNVSRVRKLDTMIVTI